MKKQELIKLISEVMYFREPDLSPPDAMKLVSEFLEEKPIHLEKLVKNNSVLDDVSKQSELLKAFIDFYNYRNTGDKTINNDEIEIFIDSL